MPNIDPDAGSVTGPTGPRGLPPVEEEKEEPEINLLALSTISQSEAERALAVLLMGYPSLVEPLDPEVLQAAIGARMAEIGSQIWDKFLEHLAEEKARIRDYLNSPKYHQWLETRSQAYLAKMESQMDVNTPGDTLSEKIRNHILSVWTNAMEGVSSYIRETRDENAGAAAFMAASFVITAGFIGDYMNIVDVASTEMVGANPIQNAVAHTLPIFPPEFQETLALTINLFAMGLIDFSRAEVLGGALKSGEPPVTKDIALAFARNVLAKVQGNEVNALLMAMLVNSTEKGVPITENRMNQFIAKAKVIMVAIALAALYIVETGKMTAEEFKDLVAGKMESRSDEETQLVQYLQGLRDSGLISGGDWNSLIEGLGNCFAQMTSAKAFFNEGEIFANIFAHLKSPEQAG